MSRGQASTHLLTLSGLTRDEVSGLLDAAEEFLCSPSHRRPWHERLAGVTTANLFFEPSTRTRMSFELAAKRLGAQVVALDQGVSSQMKGESVIDTVLTLEAMNVQIFVLRTSEDGLPGRVAELVADGTSIINAGESARAHPTQGLADALTVRRRLQEFAGLRVAMVGDIAHSRVARSSAQALATLGVTDLRLVGPAALLPEEADFPGALLTEDLAEGIAGAHVVMALRIQRERMGEAELPAPADYARRYGLNRSSLRPADENVIIMHPGPMNRGVEIDDETADGPHSVIREQVRNGVAVRMAVLEAVAGKSSVLTGECT